MTLDPVVGRVARDFLVANFVSFGPRSYGFPIRSIEIDNPTGQWLFIKESAIRVPPYTINFMANIQPSTQALEIVPRAIGGFPLAATGDQIRFVIRDYEIVPSNGISLVPNNPTTSRAEDFDTATPGGSSGNHIIIPSTQRMRLFASRFTYADTAIGTPASMIPAICILTAVTGGQFWYLTISPESPHDETIFGPGLDFAAGIDITYNMIASGAGVDCNLTSVYAIL